MCQRNCYTNKRIETKQNKRKVDKKYLDKTNNEQYSVVWREKKIPKDSFKFVCKPSRQNVRRLLPVCDMHQAQAAAMLFVVLDVIKKKSTKRDENTVLLLIV